MGRYALAWQVMAFLGLQSLLYYAALSWFPTMFRDRGVSAAAAGDLLALMNFGNAVTAMLLPVLAHRARDQRALVAVSTVATIVGLAGSAFAPLGSAAAWMLLLGLGQGATLGLAIFLTMARAPNPADRGVAVRVRAGRRLPAGQHRAAVRRPAALGHRRLGHPGRGAARRWPRCSDHRLAGRPGADPAAAAWPVPAWLGPARASPVRRPQPGARLRSAQQ